MTPTIDTANANILKNGDGTFIDFANPGTAAIVNANLNTYNYFSVVLGLPLNCSGGACVATTDDNTLITGLAAGATYTSFPLNGDAYWINIAALPRGAFAGGSWVSTSQTGRFALSLNFAPSNTGSGFGSRCAVALP